MKMVSGHQAGGSKDVRSHHLRPCLFFGTYLAYLAQIKAMPLLFLMAPWDREVRRAAKSWLGDVVRHPGRLFDGL